MPRLYLKPQTTVGSTRHCVCDEGVLALPIVQGLEKVQRGLDQVISDALCARDEMIADQDPAARVELRSPPANSEDSVVEVSKNLFVQPADHRGVHANCL